MLWEHTHKWQLLDLHSICFSEIKTLQSPTASVSCNLSRVNNIPRSQSCEVAQEHLSHRLPAEEGSMGMYLYQHLIMAMAGSGSPGRPRNGDPRLTADSAGCRELWAASGGYPSGRYTLHRC